MRTILSLLAVALLIGCPQLPPKPPVTDGDAAVDSAVLDSASMSDGFDGTYKPDVCSKACSKMSELGCPEGMPADAGKSCYTLCMDTQASKKFDLKPECIAVAKSVAEVRGCGTVRCQK